MIKSIYRLFAVFILTLFGTVHAQQPVSWKYSAKKVDDKTYEVHLTASVQRPWHIYSQATPEGGPKPTVFNFSRNPLVNLSGKVKEVGNLVQKHVEVFDIDVRYFDGGADFVQTVKLKSKAKTNLSGSIDYMACNDTQCLSPKTVQFSVKLE